MNLLKANIEGVDFVFETKGGVFSAREVDPGTRLLAEQISRLRSGSGEPRRILDLGCGYGVLGIVAARCNPKAEIILSDDSLRASKLAKRNVELNQVKNARVVLSDGFAELEGKFDVILSNPPIGMGKELMEELIEDSLSHLSKSGTLWIVTQNRFKPYVQRLFKEHGGDLEILGRGKEHFVAQFSRD